MSIVVSVIIGLVVFVFAVMALAPLFFSEKAPEATSQVPRLRVIEGGKSTSFTDAA